MKRIYILISFCSLAFTSTGLAQCTCAGGAPASTISHSARLDSVTSLSTITFPKFNPAVGTLACMTMDNYVTAIMRIALTNKQSFDFEYNIKSNMTATVAGASGFFTDGNVQSTYGPYDLGPYLGGTDEINIGPDTIFNNANMKKTYASNLAAYMGTGNVSFQYDLSGAVWAQPTSGNYNVNVNTYSYVDVNLTYYWCPNSVLSSNIKDFYATKKDNSVNIQWLVSNPNKSNTYEIETSSDGKSFTKAGSATATTGTSTKYQYQYNLDQAVTGTIFFRIKETDVNGKITYSEIRSITEGKQDEAVTSLYPNPAVKGVTLQFEELVKGDVEVELVNSIGQSIFRKLYKLDRSNIVKIEWPFKPLPGVYYLRTKNVQKQTQSISKLFIK